MQAASWPFLHPARSVARAARLRGCTARPLRLGLLGEVHPLVAGEWDLERTAVFAIDLGKLAQAAPAVVAFRAFGAYPPLRQDIAVVVPEQVVPAASCSSACARRPATASSR